MEINFIFPRIDHCFEEDVDIWVGPANCTRAGIEELIKEMERCRWELVIKPSQGFTLVNTREERIEWAIKYGMIPFRKKETQKSGR